MARFFPLELVTTAQEIPIPGGEVGFHTLYLAFSSAPSAGTVTITSRQIGSAVFAPIVKATAVSITSGELAVRVDRSIAAIRVQFAGLTGGVAPGLWLHSQSIPQDAFNGLAAIISQPYTEANVKNGLQYDMRASWRKGDEIPNGAAPGSQRRIRFTTGAKTVLIKLREFQFMAEELTLRLFSGPTITGAGTALSINNYNARNPVASTVTAAKNVTTSSDGTEFNANDPEVFFGSAVAPQRQQSVALQGRERILLPNTTYLVLISNTGADAARVEYHLDWYEGDTDIPI